MNHLTTCIVQSSVPGVTPSCLDHGLNPSSHPSSWTLDVLLAAAIPDAIPLPTDKCFAQEVPEHAYDGLTCPKYAIWDSNPGSWLAKHHAKHDRRCWSANSGRLMTLLDLSPADFRRFLTVFVDRRLLGSQCCLSTGLVANGIRLTKRCNALSSRSDVTRGLLDLGKSITLLVCVCFLTSQLTTV
jgi:hypothetical protein